MGHFEARTNGFASQRQAGRRQVLSVIRTAEQIARIDIADRIGGSPATVTAITAELLEAGLIEEHTPDTKPSDPPRGRPRPRWWIYYRMPCTGPASKTG